MMHLGVTVLADLTERPGQRTERKSDKSCADDIEPARLSCIRRREGPEKPDNERGDRRIDPKYRLPTECLRQPASKHGAGRRRQRRRRRPNADGSTAFGFGISSTDQRETCWRQQCRTDSLHNPRGDEQGRGRHQSAGDRCGPKHEAAERQNSRLAAGIGKRAADQRQRCQRQYVTVNHPLYGGEVQANGSAQPGQRDSKR